MVEEVKTRTLEGHKHAAPKNFSTRYRLRHRSNPDPLNERDTKTPDWGIKGVVRGGKGKSTKGTKSFRLIMGIQ